MEIFLLYERRKKQGNQKRVVLHNGEVGFCTCAFC
jgi:hypothetical protein